jgi:hypothetical protein
VARVVTVMRSGWMPEIPTRTGRTAANDAHYVRAGAERHEVTFDVYYLAECGARCFPFYSGDPTNRMARHPRHEVCVQAAALIEPQPAAHLAT